MREKTIAVGAGDRAAFRNLARSCVGTGRVDLALHSEYREELRAVQELCGFRLIRGHGLFSDPMGIFRQVPAPGGGTRTEYCYTYLDRVVDCWMDCGLRPFLELGFMPAALTDSPNTLFYWNAHTAPPRDPEAWADLVSSTLRHLVRRYGESEVAGWPCEIWNEPNLPGFWENADKPAYLRLYRRTVQAVREAVPGMRVGGPAICGGDGSQQWIADFLAFCRDEKVPVDFVTRHAYLGDTPERRGRYLYQGMRTPEDVIGELRESRRVIDSFPEYRGLPMYVTEFNTSYHPFCPIHDTCRNAALTAALLARMGDVADGCSYWTFGDVFEENGVPTRLFHGGFGLTAAGCVPKPTLWAFSFFAGLGKEALYRDENAVVTRRPDAGIEAVLWDLSEEGQETREALRLTLRLPVEGPCAALLEVVDGESGNPLRAWHRMGEPACPDAETLAFLRQAAQPRRTVLPVTDGCVRLTLAPDAVARLRVLPAPLCAEPGYDYEYYPDG